MPTRPNTRLSLKDGATGNRKRRLFLVLALGGAGLIALSAQAVAHPGAGVPHVSVDGAAATKSSVITGQTLLVTAAPTTATPAAPVSVNAPGTAPGAHASPRPRPSVHPSGIAVPTIVAATGRTIAGPGLWLMARDGSGLRRLLTARPDSSAWSPDDNRIAVARNGGIDIIGVTDGTTSHLVSFAGPTLIASLAWSLDERLIAANVMHNPYSTAAQGGPSSELMVVDALTGAATSLGHNVAAAAHPSWSAKGCLGWVSSTVDIWCPGHPLLTLPPMPGSDVFIWSPDGSRYAATSSNNATPGAIHTYAADGSGEADLANRGVYPMAWVGDGRSIVFQSTQDPTGHLWVQPVAGGPASVLTPTGGIVAVNGVDDGIIVSIGATSGHADLVSLRVSDPTQHPLVAIGPGSGGINALNWTRDGRWLLAYSTPTP
jgi:hypothetical protein